MGNPRINQRNHRRAKRDAGYCTRGGCWKHIEPPSRSYCPAHADLYRSLNRDLQRRKRAAS